MVKYTNAKIQMENHNKNKFDIVQKLVDQLKSSFKRYILKIIEYPKIVYYYHLKKTTLYFNRFDIINKIKKIVLKHPAYGYLTITAMLRK